MSVTTETLQTATLADTLLEKLHTGWRRPDLSIDAAAVRAAYAAVRG